MTPPPRPDPPKPRRIGRLAWPRLAVINGGLGVAAGYLAVTDAAGWWLLAAMFAGITLYWLRIGSRLRADPREGDPRS